MKILKNYLAVFFLLTSVMMLGSCSGNDGDAVVFFPGWSEWSEFNTSCLPLAFAGSTGSFGSFTFDGDGNLLFPMSNLDEIRSLARDSCTVTTVAAPVAGAPDLLGIVYHDGWIYVGHTNSDIHRINPETGAGSVLSTVGSAVTGLGIAPAGFGDYGGQLIVATYSGGIYALDLSDPAPVPVQLANTGTIASSMVFGSDGTLYIADYPNNKILTVTAGGTVADFATGLNQPDGLAINNEAGLLYVANVGDDTLKSVTIPGGVVTTMANYDFDGGWYPSPIIYDEVSSILLMGTGDSSMTIEYLEIN